MERLTERGEWHIDGDQGPSDAWDWVFPVSTTTSELPSVIPQYTYTDSTHRERYLGRMSQLVRYCSRTHR